MRHFSTKLDEGLLCGRVKCTTCSQKDDKKVDCFSRSVVYESVCMLCHPDGKKPKKGDPMVMSGEGTYTGETSRSIFERAGEHLEDLNGLNKDSHMVKHWFLDHPNETNPPEFEFKIIGKYKDCLTRQIKEAVRLQNRPGTTNSKGEWGGGRIPRLKIEKSEYETKKEMLIEQKEAEEVETKWNTFLKNYEDRVGVKGKRKMNTPNPIQVEKPPKRRRLEDNHSLKSQETKILAIEYFPEEAERAVHALSQDQEIPTATTPTPRTMKIPLKLKGGQPSSMTVLDMRNHFKITSKENNSSRGNEGSPKRKRDKLNDVPKCFKPSQKVQKHSQVLGREGGGS